MYKIECDSCNKPIKAEDDHLEIPQMTMVDKGQIGRMQALHFCGGKTCLIKFLDKAMNRPLLVSPATINGN